MQIPWSTLLTSFWHMLSGTIDSTTGLRLVADGGSMTSVEYIVDRAGGGGCVVMRTSSEMTER